MSMFTGRKGVKKQHYFSEGMIRYSKEIGTDEQYNPLTVGEEICLANRMKTGGAEAKDEFYKRNLRLALTIACEFNGEIEKLVSDANVGLMTAVEKFDASKGVKFSTFAAWWIKQSIIKNQREDRTVKIPVASYRKQRMVHALVEQGMTDIQIAEQLNLSRKVVRLFRLTDVGTIAIDKPIGDDGETTVANFVPSHDKKLNEVSEHVQHVLKSLDERERHIIESRFGLNGKEKRILEDIAQDFGLTRQRIEQIEAEALKKLKKIA